MEKNECITGSYEALFVDGQYKGTTCQNDGPPVATLQLPDNKDKGPKWTTIPYRLIFTSTCGRFCLYSTDYRPEEFISYLKGIKSTPEILKNPDPPDPNDPVITFEQHFIGSDHERE